MASFFDKLKKGMGNNIDETMEEMAEEELLSPMSEPKPVNPPPKKAKVKKVAKEPKEVKEEVVCEDPAIAEIKAESIVETKKEIEEKKQRMSSSKERWSGLGTKHEGQLTIDAYQTENELVIQSAVAGIDPDELEILIEKDILTIRGFRERPFEEAGDYFTQECYWGPFSREVILPVEIDPEHIEAQMREGILTIRVPKILREKKRKISIRNV